MLSAAFSLALCASFALAVPEAVHRRGARSASLPSGGSSSSYSSSSSSSSSSSLGGGGGGGEFFQFPTPFPYQNPSPLAFPMFDFNQMFRQFLASAQAAQAFAAQNPSYSKIFQQQMAILASEQQMALAQFPFAFPGLDSNFIGPDSYGSKTDYGSYGGSPAGTGGYGGGSSGIVGHGAAGGGAGGYGSGSGGYAGGSSGIVGHGAAGGGAGGYGSGSTGIVGHGAAGGGAGGYGSGSGGYAGGSSGIVGHGVAGAGAGGYGGGHKPGQDGAVFTSGSVSLGPSGGYGQASSIPGGPDGLGVRISEEFPAPGSGSFGTFSSSTSGVSSVNGKTTSYKTSTFGVNDNGKITFRTVSE